MSTFKDQLDSINTQKYGFEAKIKLVSNTNGATSVTTLTDENASQLHAWLEANYKITKQQEKHLRKLKFSIDIDSPLSRSRKYPEYALFKFDGSNVNLWLHKEFIMNYEYHDIIRSNYEDGYFDLDDKKMTDLFYYKGFHFYKDGGKRFHANIHNDSVSNNDIYAMERRLDKL